MADTAQPHKRIFFSYNVVFLGKRLILLSSRKEG